MSATASSSLGSAVTRPSGQQDWTRARARKVSGRVVLYALAAVGAVVVSLPWAWLIVSSLKTNVEVHTFPIKFLPATPVWENYWEVLYYGGGGGQRIGGASLWPLYFRNTFAIAALVEVGVLLSNSLIAFSFSRMRWRWRGRMFFLVLATMMLPRQVTMIPTYLVYTKVFDWANTWYPQIVPAFFGSAWAIFLLRQFMMTIPVEIDESARLDGCGDWSLFWRLILPMSKPALGAIAIFTFQSVWNDMFTPLLYVRKDELQSVAIGLAAMRRMKAHYGDLFPRNELVMAASFLTSIPLVALFFVFQKRYIQGVVITGVKG